MTKTGFERLLGASSRPLVQNRSVPKSKLSQNVVAELLRAGCSSCHPTNSINALKDDFSRWTQNEKWKQGREKEKRIIEMRPRHQCRQSAHVEHQLQQRESCRLSHPTPNEPQIQTQHQWVTEWYRLTDSLRTHHDEPAQQQHNHSHIAAAAAAAAAAATTTTTTTTTQWGITTGPPWFLLYRLWTGKTKMIKFSRNVW